MGASGILEEMVRKKNQQIQQIDEKIKNEQLVPTAKDKANIHDIISSISERFRKELTDKSVDKNELNERIEHAIRAEVERFSISYEEKRKLEKLAITNIIGLGPIQQYLDNPDVTEIIVQRFDNICVEKGGKIYSTKGVFADESSLVNTINRILQPVGREINISTPVVDAHLQDGSRICATIPPASPKGATLTIRKFNNKMMTAEKYLELKSFSRPMLHFLKLCMLGKISTFVSGGTGTGKTTFLNMLSSYIPDDELLVTIEDTLELQLNKKNVRSFETRPKSSNAPAQQNIDMEFLVKASLRMRPSRIIVGETRDGAVVSLLNAMATGHEGSLSTGHANSPESLVNVRIPAMMEMDRTTSYTERGKTLMIAEAIEMIVQLVRLPNGRRVVSQICEVASSNKLDKSGRIGINTIFYYDRKKDCFMYSGQFPERIAHHLENSGIILTQKDFE